MQEFYLTVILDLFLKGYKTVYFKTWANLLFSGYIKRLIKFVMGVKEDFPMPNWAQSCGSFSC